MKLVRRHTQNTASCVILIFTGHGIKAMLKVTDDLDEQAGNALMAWWEGNGAAQVTGYNCDV
jgi:streptomycin 6-kinase